MMKSPVSAFLKVFGFAVGVGLLNPLPLMSDAQMWTGAQNVSARDPSELRELCVPAEQISVEQTEVLYNGSAVSMPQMQIRTPEQHYEISLAGETQGDYDSIFSKWQDLLRGSQRVCIELESLQALESVDGVPNSLWLIRKMKSERGEWGV